MMMQMLGSFAEFERSMIRERTRAGLAAAKDDGRALGRPRSLNDKQRREIADAVLSGRKSAADMARLFGVSPATISRVVAGMTLPAGQLPPLTCSGFDKRLKTTRCIAQNRRF